MDERLTKGSEKQFSFFFIRLIRNQILVKSECSSKLKDTNLSGQLIGYVK